MEWWILAFLKIMLINILLSGDNAIVIAMASRNLPEPQRRMAIFWGAFAAIALRVLLTIIAVQLLQIPYLMAIGALLLIWVAFKLLNEEKDQAHIQGSKSLEKVVMTIVMADFIMSLDNVIAIAAVAEGDLLLITVGLLLSVPLIIWGSDLILRLLERFPVFIYFGAGILGFTAGEMLIRDQKMGEMLLHTNLSVHWILPITLSLGVVLLGWMSNRTKHMPF